MEIAGRIIFVLWILGSMCSSSMDVREDSGADGNGLGIGQEFNTNPGEEWFSASIGDNNEDLMTEKEIDALVAERAKDYTDMDAWKEKESLASSFPFPMSIEEIDTLVAERAKDHIEMDVWQEKENLAFSLQSPSTSYCPQSHAEYSYAPSSLWPECSNQAVSSSNQSRRVKRPHRSVKEKIVGNKKRKKKENAATSADTSDKWKKPSEKLDGKKKKKVERNLSVWNNSRLKERHRKAIKYGYSPVHSSKHAKNRGYIKVGDKKHIRLIQKHARHCMSMFETIPTKNRMWFIVCSRTASMHTKLADCEAIAKHPECFQWVRECDDYHPGMLENIEGFMEKHGPVCVDKGNSELEQDKIEEKRETTGNVCLRDTIESPRAIDKESITTVVESPRDIIEPAEKMIEGLPEAWKDLRYLTEDSIENMLRGEAGSDCATIIRALHVIVNNPTTDIYSPEVDSAYQALLCLFGPILARDGLSPSQKAIQIYSELYRSLVWFYKKAGMFREKLDSEKKIDKNRKEYTPVEGKHIIQDQVYLKWSARIETERELNENIHETEEKINHWKIHPAMQEHYHVHYVNNSTQQYKRLCMPAGLDGRGIHTINQIVKYIERIHGIEEENCVHPYIRSKKNGRWSYLEEKGRDIAAQEFMLYYDVVFYYIEEGLKNNYFTFAEFESFIQPEGEVVRISLFLSPLMQSIGESGPFVRKNSTEHTLVDDMQFENRKADVYAYRDKYRAYLYYSVHYYYSNLYIRVTNADICTVDCYIMNVQTAREGDSTVVTWYVKVPQSVDEYTHCALSDEFRTRPEDYKAFAEALYCQEYAPDSTLYGFGVRMNAEIDSTESSSLSTSGSMKRIVIDPLSIEDRGSDEDTIESKLSDLDIELKEIKKKEEEKGLGKEEKKELKRRRAYIYQQKCKQKKRQKDIKKESIKNQKSIPSSFLSNMHSFIVLRYSNAETKSSLGLWNELFDMFMYRYSRSPS